MKHAFACTLLLCLAFTGTAPAQHAPTPIGKSAAKGEKTMNKDEIDVQGVIEKMTTAFQNAEIDKVMGTYGPGAVVLFQPGQPVSDPEQLRQMFSGMAAAKPAFTYSGHEVTVSGDTAVHIAPWDMKAQTPDGKEIRQSGLSIAVLRRQPDGAWKMVIDNPHGARLLPGNK